MIWFQNKLLDKDQFLEMQHTSIKYTHSIIYKIICFASSNIDQQEKDALADQFRMMVLERKQNNVRNLITQELETLYSNNSVCHFVIRIPPLNYTLEAQFYLNPVFEYHYPNINDNIRLFNWQVDEETLVVFGEHFEVGQMETYQLNQTQFIKYSTLFMLRQTFLSDQQMLLTGYIHIQLLYGSINIQGQFQLNDFKNRYSFQLLF
ncbi:unnamed protein product (macronuclear) [Paramecium tetraurelia]|uniref:Uncharacterized protein n=1 Tax=Paramecium tetraurelia TaxID=5888 RepID=A0BYF7_PARTE|nr:uncharacterized protein GSPATT00033427001 [Paramecium tetraurelia]CAK63574.1 unnamed protein product [Paramecium tetraurelia]|eukprot:XP_001430972.1 hypothetical protein (macronuclear) [Paramecium tetraurelia strain d4-2]